MQFLKISFLGLWGFTLGIPYGSRAQTAPSGDSSFVWDLSKCLDYARKNNIQLNKLRLSQQSGSQDYLLSKYAQWPLVSAQLSHALTHYPSQTAPQGSYGINGSLTLYSGGLLKNDIRQKKLLVDSYGLNVQEQENNLTLQIVQEYLSILLSKENIIYLTELLSTSQAQLKLGEQQYQAGTLAKKDLAILQAQLAADKYSLVNAQNLKRQYLLNLKQLLLLPVVSQLDIAEPDTLAIGAPAASLQTVEDFALQNRPEIKNAAIGVKVAQLELAKARSGYKPVITASGNLFSNYPGIPSQVYSKTLENNFYQQVGVLLSIPIFSKKINDVNVEKSKIGIAQAGLDETNAKTVLLQSIEQSYIAVLNAQSQFEAAVEELTATTESYRIAAEQLRIGAANTVEYLQQKTLFVQAMQQYIQAKYSAILNIKIYKFYHGIPIQ